MAFKEIELPGVGKVTVFKRKGARSLRLSITSTGVTRVTIPTWAPFQAGIDFAKKRADWIRRHQPTEQVHLTNGHAIGKAHHVYLQAGSVTKPSSRISGTNIIVRFPTNLEPTDPSVQQLAEKACLRALRTEAANLLPQRLEALARHHGYSYREVNIKQLKSRWGSCDSKQNIALNLFLIQLPWDLIDYVLLHELTHTMYMHHGPDFWAAMANKDKRTPTLRKMIKSYRPVLKPRVVNEPVA
jgi:predicted metal-dependent hydrolase